MENRPEQLVAEFLTVHSASSTYLRGHITRLTELATSENTDAAESATRAVFASLVERLADSFDPEAVSLYNRAFAQVIQSCRENERGAELDRELAGFGLRSEQDLIARAEKLRQVSPFPTRETIRTVRRVVILSRVTLGADVAITSVILERIKRTFSSAEIVLLGGTKVAELFGGDPRVGFKEISYHRSGATIERLLTWIDLLKRVRELTSGLDRTEYLIVDPDTRLTQLGLLPVTPIKNDSAAVRDSPQINRSMVGAANDRYIFFPSREYQSGTSQSLSELTSSWLDEVFGEGVPTYPQVSLKSDDIAAARSLLSRLRRGSRPIIAINFGVGENSLKRVGGDFEASLVARLIQEGAAIVFDKGVGDDEIRRADSVIAVATRIERDGPRVRAVEINEQSLMGAASSEDLEADILVWGGRIGMLAALIGESDLYIGYDSAGQHIAAALGVPCIDVFAGFSSLRMLDRWRPTGKAESQLVAVETLSGSGATKDVLSEVLRYAGKMLKTWL